MSGLRGSGNKKLNFDNYKTNEMNSDTQKSLLNFVQIVDVLMSRPRSLDRKASCEPQQRSSPAKMTATATSTPIEPPKENNHNVIPVRLPSSALQR